MVNPHVHSGYKICFYCSMNTSIFIVQLQAREGGEYTCEAENFETDSRTITVNVSRKLRVGLTNEALNCKIVSNRK